MDNVRTSCDYLPVNRSTTEGTDTMTVATIYVGAIGYENCDALARVAAATPGRVQSELDRIEAEELTSYRNEECDAECGNDCEHVERFSMWQSGAWPVSALDVLREEYPIRRYFSPPSRDLGAFDWDDLRESVLHLPNY